MIDVALTFLTAELNSYLLARGARKATDEVGKVDVARLVDDGGKWAVKDDHVGLALLNIEEERVFKGQLPETVYSNGKHVVLEPRLRLNLHVIFAAKFQRYDESLRSLSLVLRFFQSHPTFTTATHPGLDPQIERLTVELQSLTYEQINQIWAFVGAKQLPSAIYKVRMVTLQDVEPKAISLPVTRAETALISQ